VPVERPRTVETTALGAAFLAGLGTGVWSSTEELRATWQLDRRFEPQADRAAADAAHARGTILGLTRGTTRAHLVRATLEAIAFEVRDVIDTMPTLASMKVDGGAAANDLLCQFQADLLGVPVERPRIVDTTALGAAFMAGLGTGVWDSTDDLRSSWQLDRAFTPDPAARDRIDAAYALWQKGVERAKDWA
jgi:glycerol kinase